jgi:methionyl-tRNA synthetase
MSEAGKTDAASASPAPAPISLDEFKRLELRIGIVTDARDHPNADRLLVLTVDVGEPSPRQLVAGIKGSYQAADLVGKQVVVVANLKPATLRGVESQGMVLAASDGASIALVAPERTLRAGSTVK